MADAPSTVVSTSDAIREADVCSSLFILLIRHIRNPERPYDNEKPSGSQTADIISAGCLAVYKKHKGSKPRLEVNGAQFSLVDLQKDKITQRLSSLSSGSAPTFLEVIRLDPDLFFRTCEIEMNAKRNPKRQPEPIQLIPEVRERIVDAVNQALQGVKRVKQWAGKC